MQSFGGYLGQEITKAPYTTSRPSFAQSVVCDAKENRVTKMAAQNPAGEGARFLAPGFRAIIFFLAVFFAVTLDKLNERGTTRSPKRPL